MAGSLKKGDAVEWNSHGGKKSRKGVATGTVLKKLTSPTRIKSHQVKATEDDPQYLVRSDNGGKAAHKPTALRRRSEAGKGASSSTGAGTKDGGKKDGGKGSSKRWGSEKASTKKASTKKASTKKASTKKASTKKASTKKARS